MAKCPKCNSNITFGQLSRYNIWRPIVCQSCKAKLVFNKKEYIKNVAYLFSASIFMTLVILGILTRTIASSQLSLLIFLCVILMIFSQIRYFVSMNSIKLDLKDENVIDIKKRVGIWILGAYLTLTGLLIAIVNFMILIVPMIVKQEWKEDGLALFIAAFTSRFVQVLSNLGIFFGGLLILRSMEFGRKISICSYSIALLLTLTLVVVESIIFKTPLGLETIFFTVMYGIPIIILIHPKVKEQFK